LAIPALVLAHAHAAERVHHCPIIAPIVPRTIGVITRRNAPLSTAAVAFRDLLFEVVTDSDLVRFPDVAMPEG